MCTASFITQFGSGGLQTPGQKSKDTTDPSGKTTAEDLPLGSGLADAGRTSIMNRREEIRKALEEAGA